MLCFLTLLFSKIFLSQGSGFRTFLCPGVGNSPFQKIPRVLPGEGWSGLELSDTLIIIRKVSACNVHDKTKVRSFYFGQSGTSIEFRPLSF